MCDLDLLEGIADTAFDPDLKATAIRDRIRDLLSDAEFMGDEGEKEEGEEE